MRVGQLVAGLVALAGAMGCGKPRPEPLRGERTAATFLDETQWRVETQDARRPVQARLVQPRAAEPGRHELLPALEMAPPARVVIDLPAVAPGTELELATGVDQREWKGEGRVLFHARIGERVLFEGWRSLGDTVSFDMRGWTSQRFTLDEVGEPLILETEYEGALQRPVLAAFGGLRLVEPYDVPRALASPREPNVVLIVVDTLRADRLHLHGNPAPVSPTFDALAARGTNFESAYSASPWTPPSTTSLLTGLAPPAHGIAGTTTQYVPEELTTLPERFRDAGLETAGFSANPLIWRNRNFSQGFRTFHEYAWTDTHEFFDEIDAWLTAQGDGRFFLYLHLVEPHDPYRPKDAWRERFAGDPPEGWVEADPVEFIKEARRLGPDRLEPLLADNRQNLLLYDAEIATIDEQLARLFGRLAQLGLEERTVVALTSDHGEEFLEHGLIVHALQLHDESVRVPLILAGPGVPVGLRCEDAVENHRLGATLLRLANVDLGDFAPEEDLLLARVPRPVFTTTTRGNLWDASAREWLKVRDLHSVRDGTWRLDWAPNPPGDGGELVRLYDLEADPEARADIADAHPDRVERMKRSIRAWTKKEAPRRARALREGTAEGALLRATGYAGTDGDE